MANELNSQWQRLYDRYHAMSDDELLELAENVGGLTETAADVLRQEMRDRRLQAAPSGNLVSVTAPDPNATRWNPGVDGTRRGEVALMTFHDAINAGIACDSLEEHEIDFEMKDVSSVQTDWPVSLNLIVNAADKERAMSALRQKMGLFPLQEVAVADEIVDDGTIATMGAFGHRDDAEAIAHILEDAGIWHRIVADPEGTVENENAYTLEVREVDMVRAGEVVEKAIE